MRAYVINLDSAVERWQFAQEHFAATGIPVTRIPGVDGAQLPLPIPEYSERAYERCHGQRTSRGQVGCYLGHVAALRAFLDSAEPVAVIAEDDARPATNLADVLECALRYQASFDILRLCGFHNAHPVPYATIRPGHRLCVCFTRLCGTGAYLVTRAAAEVLVDKLLPMRVPIDHALDREWVYCLRSAAIMPLPVTQFDHAFDSQTGRLGGGKLPWWRRYWTVFPWRARNEVSRVVQRSRQLRAAVRIARAVACPPPVESC